MIVTLVYIQVKKQHVEAFIEATKKNHAASIQEKGNLRFDVLQDEVEATKFVLYEAYETEAAVAAHKETKHYDEWRNTVAEYMDGPRHGVRHKVIAPKDAQLW
jgi:autoinducer 2-degrading protein